MTTAWIDGATVIEAVANGGTMTGEDYYATWHSTENDPYTTKAANIARYLNQTRNCVQVLWNPVDGDIVVTMPPTVAGRGLENPAGGVETNRNGKINVQIEVVARASKPFTDYPMVGRERLLAALDELHIPRKFSVGRPLPYPKSYGLDNGQRRASQAGSGHVTHSQWNENVHGDPGAIDPDKLLSGVPSQPSRPPVVPPNHKEQYVREDGDGKYERGEFGPGITTLQTALNAHGFPCGTPDGFFGLATLNAVKRCQLAHHLAQTGVADATVQTLLGLRHAHPAGPSLKVDGVFGEATMKALQEAVGVKADGWYAYSPPYSYNLGSTTTAAILRHLGVHGNVIEAMQTHLHVSPDGKMGHDTVEALQRALNAHKF